ncbi:MAG: tryptophan synthase subunit alpha [Ectobacillus sp.]
MRTVFTELQKQNKKAFVPYIMAGDGGMEKFKENIMFLDQAGASVLEIGIPFSDPVADGPTIQRAGKRALESGTTLDGIFQALAEVRPLVSVPFVLMTYLNPILAFGKERFVQCCIEAGVDGLIIPDLPFEEKEIIHPLLKEAEISLIQLVTLTSPPERLQKIASEAEGFLYAVTVTGVTGARREFQDSLYGYLQQVKKISSIPVLAGFGISEPEQAREVAAACDGVVVGSRIIDLLEEQRQVDIQRLIAGLNSYSYR